ncbi:nucleosome-binding component of the SWR1 complex, putative [Candida dubliniensis CD36]|uniref:Vacuolar protein sorting-associated protein, putative n=1 Tax=Candida dubliniensis (strain CD36 / ATCC MYA-646 / CBS 7987 / NCPF 3949 / NRRL Y-17841) TaxID=573826 RepID=B9WFH7_CANDC|nr:nucleosome-binding component of the SWR1 complex, putative [Candida dubliniensis CD36]CAX41996.1 nucleosome-binding component of the SWR1 complex, putative [Candida dubliniensis CD36]
MLVEEVPKSTNAKTSTIYFSSSINLTARSLGKSSNTGESISSSNKGRAKVNYNLTQLMNAQTQSNEPSNTGPLKSSQQIQLERLVLKRLVELNQETSIKGFELPKNFVYTGIHSTGGGDNTITSHKSRLGNTPTTKKILAARRNLNSYFEEERNLISVNTILGINYQFVDFTDINDKSISTTTNKRRKLENVKPKIRLCCICGNKSNYSRCSSCGLYYCSVKCNNLHQESRCA